jgi:hypothetical protein
VFRVLSILKLFKRVNIFIGMQLDKLVNPGLSKEDMKAAKQRERERRRRKKAKKKAKQNEQSESHGDEDHE